jgi:hypothetical protein
MVAIKHFQLDGYMLAVAVAELELLEEMAQMALVGMEVLVIWRLMEVIMAVAVAVMEMLLLGLMVRAELEAVDEVATTVAIPQ